MELNKDVPIPNSHSNMECLATVSFDNRRRYAVVHNAHVQLTFFFMFWEQGINI